MRYLALAFSVAALLLAGPGCRKAAEHSHAGHRHDDGHDHSDDTALVLPVQTGAAMRASMSVVPFPPISGEKTLVQLSLADMKGQMISGRKVSLELRGPGKDTPPIRATARDRGDGLYQADFRFPEGEAWDVSAQVTGNGKPETFSFRLTPSPPAPATKPRAQ